MIQFERLHEAVLDEFKKINYEIIVFMEFLLLINQYRTCSLNLLQGISLTYRNFSFSKYNLPV